MDKRIEKIIISHDEIIQKTKELAQWVDQEYKNSESLLLIGILKGCIPFFAELIKHITIDHEIDFMAVKSYHGSTKPSKMVLLEKDISLSINNKDVLIVEDIIESGNTISKIASQLQLEKAKSVQVLPLLIKENESNKELINSRVKKYGFYIEDDDFLVGFGLDYKEKLRNLPYFGVLKKEYLD